MPKLRLTYYLYEEAIQPVIETVMPIIFAYVANTYNIINSFKDEEREFKDYLANNVGIGLTIVFIIPSIAKERRVRRGVEVELRVCRVDLRVARPLASGVPGAMAGAPVPARQRRKRDPCAPRHRLSVGVAHHTAV